MQSQTFADWEWCVVDDCSTRPEVRSALASLGHADPRIRVLRRDTNGGIVAASNDALAMCRGEFVAFLDHDDSLVPTALEQMASTLGATGDVDYVYSDETHVFVDGREAADFCKPDWSPERFRSSMYTCHLSMLRRDVITEVGGFRAGFDGRLKFLRPFLRQVVHRRRGNLHREGLRARNRHRHPSHRRKGENTKRGHDHSLSSGLSAAFFAGIARA